MHAIIYVIAANIEVIVSTSSFGQASLKQIMQSCNQDGDIPGRAMMCLRED
jgi:hypothetical protein